MDESPTRYTRTAVSLHWLIAGFIACGFAIGYIMTDLPPSPHKLKMFSWHKWIGITVLALAAIRGLWRLTHRPPPMVAMPHLQARAAWWTHVLMYVLLFVVPLTGWAFSSASGYPVVYLGLWQLPDFVPKDKALADSLGDIHQLLAWTLAALVGVHALAALKHHFFDRDETLRRMLRWS